MAVVWWQDAEQEQRTAIARRQSIIPALHISNRAWQIPSQVQIEIEFWWRRKI